MTIDIDVVRAAQPKAELRALGDAVMPTLVVRFSQFNTWYEIDSLWEGTFLERTVPGAFKRTIREDRDQMRVLYDHGFDSQIGNKVLGPIESLKEAPDSPVAEVPLFDTQYNRELLPGLEAGVYGSSFRFRVTSESWADPGTEDWVDPGNKRWKDLPQRTINETRVMEFGPVTFPANPDSTASVEPRSLTDVYYEQLSKRDEQAYDAAVRCIQRSNPDFTGRPVARSTGGGENDAKRRHLTERHRALQMAGILPASARLPERNS